MKNLSSKPKLLFISHDGDFKGGAEVSLFALMLSARDRGYDVHAVLPNQSEFARRLKDAGIPATILSYKWWTENFQYEINEINLTLKLAHIIQTEAIGCVVSNTSVIPWGAVAASLANVPHVWILREFPEGELSYLTKYYDIVQNFSNLLIANSKNLANSLMSAWNLSNVKSFYSYVDAGNLRLNHDLSDTRIIQVGNIEPRKNQLELIEAFAQLKHDTGITTKLLLIGHPVEQHYMDLVQKLVLDKGLTDSVEFMPFTLEPWKVIGPRDIFVQTSTSESIGRTTTEAMKLGLICVGSDIPGVREAFKLGGGHLYKSGESAELARVLQAIVEDMDIATRRAAVAQKQALRNMSETSCHDPFFKELEKIVSQTNVRSELRHILPTVTYVSDMYNVLQQHVRLVENQSQTIAQLRSDLNNVVLSRSWKAILMLRKLLRK